MSRKKFGAIFSRQINRAVSASSLLAFLTVQAAMPALSRSLALEPKKSQARITNPSGSQSPSLPETQSGNGDAIAASKEADDLDPTHLVKECDANGAAMHKRLLEYTYSLKKTRRILNERGKVSDELAQDFEAYSIRGEHVLIQLSENGVPRSPWQVAADRRRAGRDLQRAEREENHRGGEAEAGGDNIERHVTAGVMGKYRGKYAVITIDLSEFLQSCDFSSPRQERIEGRDMIVLDFRPREGVSFAGSKTFMSRLLGSVWIDSIDKVVTRLEGWPAPQFAAAKEAKEAQAAPRTDAALIYQQMRLPDGLWFPQLIRMNASSSAELFNGLNWDVVFEFSDYKHFNAEIEDYKVDKVNSPPDKH